MKINRKVDVKANKYAVLYFQLIASFLAEAPLRENLAERLEREKVVINDWKKRYEK